MVRGTKRRRCLCMCKGISRRLWSSKRIYCSDDGDCGNNYCVDGGSNGTTYGSIGHTNECRQRRIYAGLASTAKTQRTAFAFWCVRSIFFVVQRLVVAAACSDAVPLLIVVFLLINSVFYLAFLHSIIIEYYWIYRFVVQDQSIRYMDE